MSKYLIVGVSVYVLELAIVIIAGQLGASAVVSVALSYVIGTTVSFLLQKFVTFGDKRTHHTIIISQAAATILLLLWNFGFTLLLTKLLDGYLPAVVIRTMALGITTIWNFYLYKTRIFNKDAVGIVD